MAHWYCSDCGSSNLKFTLGTCTGCGESLDGERDPKSRTEGMFHPICWRIRRVLTTRITTTPKPVLTIIDGVAREFRIDENRVVDMLWGIIEDEDLKYDARAMVSRRK